MVTDSDERDESAVPPGGTGRGRVRSGGVGQLAILGAAALALSACDSRVNVAEEPVADAVPDPDGTLAGLYDSSVELEGIGLDVMRLRVTDDGRLIEYDHQADDVDRGADCHTVRTLSLALAGEAGRVDDGARSADFSLRAVEGGLELGFVDVADLDADGDVEETLTTVLERLDGFDESSMNWCL